MAGLNDVIPFTHIQIGGCFFISLDYPLVLRTLYIVPLQCSFGLSLLLLRSLAVL